MPHRETNADQRKDHGAGDGESALAHFLWRRFGSGFDGVLLSGKEHNDLFRAKRGQVYTTTNRSGGVQGGISNGESIHFRVAFKPTATVLVEQDTVDINHKNTTLKARGRHDPCVLPRAVPIVESMTALVLIDHALRHHAQCR